MPDLKDHGREKERQGVPDSAALHDGLVSNPDLREAYNEAVRDGLSPLEAHKRARIEVFDEEHWAEVAANLDVEDPDVGKARDRDWDYERVDDLLTEAHEKTVQWGVTEENPDLSKAPGVWESQDEIPDFVLDTLDRLIVSGNIVWQGDYERLPPAASATVQKVLQDKLTQPQGWSLASLEDALRDELGDLSDDLSSEYLLNILRNETSAVLNDAKEEAFRESEERRDEEFLFDWVGPTDHRTTDTCLAIEERIEDEGGAVTMDRLKQILYEEALDHADAEGTPERADDWQPHWQCRRTPVRRVQSL